jgi:eukaryotic-like serine/threonine-protein kinase
LNNTRLPPAPPSASQLSALALSLGPALPRPGSTIDRPRILFVDDEVRILSALSALFRQQYHVMVSSGGAHALQLVKEHRPPVVVSDQRMPAMPGTEFLRQAREIDSTSTRILLTGYSDLAAIVGSINDGEIFRFVNKPWDNQELRETVTEAMDIAISTRAETVDVPLELAPGTGATAAIVVAQESRELFDLVMSGIAGHHPVCHATSVKSVLRTIEEREVAILLCDLDGFHGADVMLKLVKRSHPAIQSVAVAAASDSGNLISLINQAQIFRFMNRPVRPGLLDRTLRSALTVGARYRAQPQLARRQKVQVAPEVAESTIGRQILQRLGLMTKPALPGARVPQRGPHSS